MATDPEKTHIVSAVREGLADAERAIRNHPPATVTVYEKGIAAFRQGQDNAPAPEGLAASGLSLEDYKALRLYVVAMAFISAWYHRHGDKERRDKAAHSASLLVAGTGLPSESVFRTFLEFEQLWRRTFAQEGIGHSKFGCLPAVVACVAAGITIAAT